TKGSGRAGPRNVQSVRRSSATGHQHQRTEWEQFELAQREAGVERGEALPVDPQDTLRLPAPRGRLGPITREAGQALTRLGGGVPDGPDVARGRLLTELIKQPGLGGRRRRCSDDLVCTFAKPL